MGQLPARGLTTELLMAAHVSAETGEMLKWPVTGLKGHVPEVPRGRGSPQ